MEKYRFASLMILAFLLVVALACRPDAFTSGEGSSEDTLARIKERQQMRVGYLVWPPAVIRDDRTGKLTGIFPPLIEEIASAINVEVVWEETTLANFAAGLVTDQFDFSVGPTFTTIPRAEAVAFTQPVAYVGNAAVVRAASDLRPESIEQLDKEDIRIAVLQGQALEEYVSRKLPNAKVVVFSGGNLTAPLAAVSAGRADIGFMNSVTVSQYAAEHPEVVAVLMEQQVEILPLSWATRPSDQRLLTFLNNSITYMKTNGRLAEAQSAVDIQLLYDLPALSPITVR